MALPDPNPAPPTRAQAPDDPRLLAARGQFRTLLVGNPNYFGTAPNASLPAVLPVSGNTGFERLACVGYEPQLRRLAAVVEVLREGGYGGPPCGPGTPEYVRFYLSFDDGATWQDQGVAACTAHDFPGPRPLAHAVGVPASPRSWPCTRENLPLVRAILSWNHLPPASTPGYVPVWGEVRETRVQVAPRRRFVFGDLLTDLKLQPAQIPPYVAQIDPAIELPALRPTVLAPAALHARYAQSEVPAHRYLAPAVRALAEQPAPAAAPDAAKAPGVAPLLDLGIDLADVVAKLLAVDGDTTFEQLGCVGLDGTSNTLLGVVTVKRPNGYSGGLCDAGSQEYVAFWTDDGTGWRYQGTSSVRVHDLRALPAGGVRFAVVLPVDLAAYRRPCAEGAVTLRVRAILSWNAAPDPTDPDDRPRWGNRREAVVEVRPGPRVGSAQVPFLSAVGDMPESVVGAGGTATGLALHTGFAASDSPFGGRITIAGHVSNPTSDLRYRVERKPHGAPDSSYLPLPNEHPDLTLTVNTWDPVLGWQQTQQTVAAVGGYYPYLDYSANHSVEGDLMHFWASTAAEDGGQYDLRIALRRAGAPADVYSNVVTVLVDNSSPDAELTIAAGGGRPCADLSRGEAFSGTFVGTARHYRSGAFVLLPAAPAHGATPAPTPADLTSVRYGGLVADPGVAAGTYTLATAGMDPCGYTLTLVVTDRTNLNSGAGSRQATATVGFCVRAGQG